MGNRRKNRQQDQRLLRQCQNIQRGPQPQPDASRTDQTPYRAFSEIDTEGLHTQTNHAHHDRNNPFRQRTGVLTPDHEAGTLCADLVQQPLCPLDLRAHGCQLALKPLLL